MYFFILFITGCAMAVSIARILDVLCIWAVLLGGVLLLNCACLNKMLVKSPFWAKLAAGGSLLWGIFYAARCAAGACDAMVTSLLFIPFFIFIAAPLLLTCSMMEGVKKVS